MYTGVAAPGQCHVYQLEIPFRPLLGRIKRAIVPASRVPAALENRLLFRFGFICYAAADPPRGDALWARVTGTWRRIDFGGFTLLAHPETRVTVVEAGDRFTILIGDAFFSSGATDAAPIDALAAAEADLPVLLDRLSGCFAVIARRGGKTAIYNDAYGSQSVFYRRSGAFAVASHGEIFAHTFADRRHRDMAELVASKWFGSMKRAYLPTDATLFDGVYALLPNHRYAVEGRRLERFWPRLRRRDNGTFDSFYSVFDEYLRALAGHMRGHRLIVSITGGVDSRTLIAALRHYATPFRTVTWTSFNFAEWEREPIGRVHDYIRTDHSWVDRRNDRIGGTALLGVRNSGNYRGASPAVAGMARLFGSDPRNFFLSGIGAGVIRATAEIDELTPHGILGYFLHQSEKSWFEHEAFVIGEIESMLERNEFAEATARGYLGANIFNWEHQAGTWGACSVNAMRTAVDSMLGFNSRLAADAAMALPEAERNTKRLFADVIARYDPQLAAIHYQ